MELRMVFIGRAEPLAEQYAGVGATSFAMAPGGTQVLPGIGDEISLRMHPGPDIRRFRCTARHFDFGAAGSPSLTLELDLP